MTYPVTWPYRHDEDGPVATEAEAHAEWHRNAGVPMGPRGGSCPWDSCGWADDEEPYDDRPNGELQPLVDYLETRYDGDNAAEDRYFGDYDDPPF